MRRIRNTSLTIDTTNTPVSPALYGNKRMVLILSNTSIAGEKISIAVGSEAVLGQGIVLNQNDKMTLTSDGTYLPSVEQINAIATVNTATLSVYEETE